MLRFVFVKQTAMMFHNDWLEEASPYREYADGALYRLRFG
jgi:hypothetical protein